MHSAAVMAHQDDKALCKAWDASHIGHEPPLLLDTAHVVQELLGVCNMGMTVEYEQVRRRIWVYVLMAVAGRALFQKTGPRHFGGVVNPLCCGCMGGRPIIWTQLLNDMHAMQLGPCAQRQRKYSYMHGCHCMH